MNHPWWHFFFTICLGEEFERVRGNYAGSKWRYKHHYFVYHCYLCGKTHKKDVIPQEARDWVEELEKEAGK